MRRVRLWFLAVVTGIILAMTAAPALACSNPCPPGQYCLAVCMPDFW